MTAAVELAEAAWSCIEAGDMERLVGLFADDAELTTAAGGGRGHDYIAGVFSRHVQGYPDLRHRLLDMIESADRQAAALRIEFEATHLGELRGPVGAIAPTGKRLTWRSADQVRTRDGQITSWHAQFDRLAILLQLGLADRVARPTSSGEVGKGILRAVLTECFEQGNIEALDNFVTSDFVNHRRPPGIDGSSQGVQEIVKMERAAFPDITFSIDHEVAEGDMVVQVATAEATHLGTIFGVAPTAARVRWQQVHIARMREGKMAEHWGLSDVAGLMRQMRGDGDGATEPAFSAADRGKPQ